MDGMALGTAATVALQVSLATAQAVCTEDPSAISRRSESTATVPTTASCRYCCGS
jgi:hypothetical protein